MSSGGVHGVGSRVDAGQRTDGVVDFLGTAITWIGGDPDAEACAACGHPWRPGVAEARATIATAPETYPALLATGDPYRVPDGLTWHGTAYTVHVADLCRAWAERIVGHVGEPERQLAGFDPDELADARNYLGMTATAAAWSLRHGVELLLATADDEAAARTFHHDEWGEASFGDGLRWLAHEVAHHEQDLARCLA